MIKTKIKRIEELNDKYLIMNEKEMKFLRKCLKSRKQDVRWTAAEILVGWYTPENERLLYNLTYDKAELVCVEAAENELEEFNAIAFPVLEQLNSNKAENKRLSALRDALLPKLMSGELDVSDIDL